jgi:dTDP-4-dehydrorhamnose 3,5-epimerase
MTEITRLAIPDVLLITPKRHGDARGFFSETYSRKTLEPFGFDKMFVQDNHSLSEKRGVLRGLHFQRPPFMQDKLLRVTQGAIYDVAVDIRQDSPTYGRWVGAELSADNWSQLLVPAGFAHGFVTLQPNTAVLYKVTADYAPETEGGLAWDDPDLAIDWPLPAADVITNPRDGQWPRLKDLEPLPAA